MAERYGDQWRSNDGRLHDSWASANDSDYRNNQIAEDRKREAAAEAAYDDLEDRWKDEQIRIGSAIIENYMNAQWDRVIGIDASTQFEQRIYDGRIFALKAIAYAKKGDYENALRMMPYFELIGGRPDNIFNYSEKALEFIESISSKLDTLVMETIKQSFSEKNGRQVTDVEFKQFQISFCEKEIVRNWTEMDGERLINYWKSKWGILSGKSMSSSELNRIAGGNKRLTKMFMEKRNGFVSFLIGLTAGFGAAIAIDWYSLNPVDGVNISLIAAAIAVVAVLYTFWKNVWCKEAKAYIGGVKESVKITIVIAAALVIIVLLDMVSRNMELHVPIPLLIFLLTCFAAHFWRNRNNFFAIIMIAIGIFGWLVLFGIFPNENLSIFEYTTLFKEIFN